MVRGQWANLGFFMTTESQDLGLTSHPKKDFSQITHLYCTSQAIRLKKPPEFHSLFKKTVTATFCQVVSV